jgi:hypothetical protein
MAASMPTSPLITITSETMPLLFMKSMISWPLMSGRRRSSSTRSNFIRVSCASASLPQVAVTSW